MRQPEAHRVRLPELQLQSADNEHKRDAARVGGGRKTRRRDAFATIASLSSRQTGRRSAPKRLFFVRVTYFDYLRGIATAQTAPVEPMSIEHLTAFAGAFLWPSAPTAATAP